MEDKAKTKEQLINEVVKLRRNIAELEQMDTERKYAEESIKEQERFTEELIENSAVATFVLNQQHKVILWNKACEELTGISASDMKDTDHQWKPFYTQKRRVLADIIIDGSFDEMPSLYDKYAQSTLLNNGLRSEGWYKNLNGRDRYIIFDASPILNTKGEMVAVIQTLQDISERKSAEEALHDREAELRESEHKYRDLVENANSIILRWNCDGEITFLNEFGYKFFGYREDEILGHNVIGTITPETESTGRDLRPLMESICKNPTAFEQNVNENMLRDGRRVWIAWTNKTVFDAEGTLVEVLSIGTDVTDRKRAEEVLHKNDQLLRRAEEVAKFGNWEFFLDENKVQASEGARAIYGLEIKEWSISDVRKIALPEYRTMLARALKDLIEEGIPYNVEFKICRPTDGKIIHINSMAEYDAAKNVVFGVIQDITDRKQVEAELRIAHEKLELRVVERTLELNESNEQLRNLAAHLQSVREDERIKIAREIHDDLGQTLAAQKMELSWFLDKYGDHKLIFNKANTMLDNIDLTIQAVKRICTELRPSLLDDFGLAEAMQWQANEFQKRTRIECTVESSPEDFELDKERSTVLFRIFQETLTNVLKHAEATKVIARLTEDNGNILLEVKDNGKGLTNEELSKHQSFGIIGMRERVYPWGGEIKITTYKNRGTTIKVSMPPLTSPKNN